MIGQQLSKDKLSRLSTAKLTNKLLELTKGQDTAPLSQKVQFYQNELKPLFEELSRRNPFPTPEEQAPIVLGVWLPIWSTIPFQDILPGRIHEQSYQIFHDNGYYANIARYAPGYKRSFWQKLSPILFAYDLMVLQKFEIKNGQWYIQNVGIEQAFRTRRNNLSINKAEDWFTQIVESKLKEHSNKKDSLKIPKFQTLDQNTAKKFEKVLLATPQLEHLYIDHGFRLVKTRREAKQRPSYTIAVRIQ